MRWGWRGVWLVALVWSFMPWLLKSAWIGRHLWHLTGNPWLGALEAWLHDAWLWGLIVAGLYACACVANRVVAWIGVSFFMTLYLVYVTDLIILFNFNNRLNLVDSYKYASATTEYAGQLLHGFSAVLMACAVMGALALLMQVWAVRHQVRWRKTLLIVPLSLLIGLFGLRGGEQYAHAWLYSNVFEYQWQIRSEQSPYSAQILQQLRPEPRQCQQHNSVPPRRIVLLMVESLSNYQSGLFSGIQNWTPHLDQIAQQHRYYPNFYANGFTTEDGEIALLTGRVPLPPVGHTSTDGGTSFHGFWQVHDALPQRLADHGYHTSFLTSSDLWFSQTGAWAKQMGFKTVLGSNNPAFANAPRYQFDSVADEILLTDAQSRILAEKGRGFFFIKTVSTHHPFTNPRTQQRSPEAAFRYADQVIGEFYQALLQQGFFQDGLLMIVGDHHAMLPITAAELERFGAQRAAARVPLTVVGQGSAQMEQLAQQTDVYRSILGQVTGEYCVNAWEGVLWGRPTATQWVLFRRGDRRDQVSVFAAQQDYVIRLNGDQTQVIHPQGVSARLQQTLVNRVNRLRGRVVER